MLQLKRNTFSCRFDTLTTIVPRIYKLNSPRDQKANEMHIGRCCWVKLQPFWRQSHTHQVTTFSLSSQSQKCFNKDVISHRLILLLCSYSVCCLVMHAPTTDNRIYFQQSPNMASIGRSCLAYIGTIKVASKVAVSQPDSTTQYWNTVCSKFITKQKTLQKSLLS